MKVIVATDGSQFGKHAVNKCLDFVHIPSGSELLVMSVVEPFVSTSVDSFGLGLEAYHEAREAVTEFTADLVEKSAGIISERAAKLGQEDLKITTRVISDKSPKAAIVEQAEAEEADLVIVGSHGYGFINRMLLGSVSNYVVHHAPCTVLVIKLGKQISGS